MEPQNFNPDKVRRVALLDLVLTVALVVHIIYFTLYPALTQNYMEVEEKVVTENPWLLWYGQEAQTKPPDTEKTSRPLLWTFLGAVILFGVIVVLAAVVLHKSASKKLHPGEALPLIQFWMHCNYLALLTTVVGLYMMLIFIAQGSKTQGYPMLTLLFYFGIRLIFTVTVFRQLRILRGPQPEETVVAPVYDGSDGKTWRYAQAKGYMIRYEWPPRPEPPILNLGPYKGGRMSGPKCQCLAPQTV